MERLGEIETDVEAETVGRLRLWELDSGSHCSIVGTCFSLDELRRILRKAELPIAPDAEDYDIHGYVVSRAGTRSVLSKLLHKALDRKYARHLARYRRAGSVEALWALWQEGRVGGEIAGTYWALMTEKRVPSAMRIRAFNQVHMLSHLTGRSGHDEARRLSRLEATLAALSDRLAKTRARADEAGREKDARIRALEAKLAIVPVPQALPAADPGRQGVDLDRLRARIATLEQALLAERARAEAAETGLRDLRQAASCAGSDAPDIGEEAGPAAAADLQGCALLYVGGHPHAAPRLKAQVERMQGTFLYHDGGIEAQSGKLPGLVSQADAVFCPVVCVSHDACLRLKQLCKRQGKRFVPLRSAGLSGFVSALHDMARDAGVPA
jgi:hypothetical protein